MIFYTKNRDIATALAERGVAPKGRKSVDLEIGVQLRIVHDVLEECRCGGQPQPRAEKRVKFVQKRLGRILRQQLCVGYSNFMVKDQFRIVF